MHQIEHYNFEEAEEDGWVVKLSGTYRCYSNFWFAQVLYRGIMFPTNEHAFVAAKASHMPKSEFKAWVNSPLDKHLPQHSGKCMLQLNPFEVKKFGRSIPLREDWEYIKFDVMDKRVLDKFTRNMDLQQVLVSGPKRIMEGNTWGDMNFGVIETKSGLKGNNGLGKSLMKARRLLK